MTRSSWCVSTPLTSTTPVERAILESRVWRERALIEWTLGFEAGARDRDGRLEWWRCTAFLTVVSVALGLLSAFLQLWWRG